MRVLSNILENIQENKSLVIIPKETADTKNSVEASEMYANATLCRNCSETSCLRIGEEKYRNKSGDAVSPSKLQARPASFHLKKSSRLQTIFIFSTLFSLMSTSLAATVVKDECNPKDPKSCSFGATCQLDISVRTPYFRCTCPKINCFQVGLFDPICGLDGTTKTPFFNVMCLILEECTAQRPIQQLCYGSCSGPCQEITLTNKHHERCPEKDQGLCLNGGLCVHHPMLKESSCRCTEGFTGKRCEAKLIPRPSKNDGNCNSNSKLLTIFAIVLLAVILLAIIACLCWKRRKNEDEKIWPKSDKDETTPLRENTRSDYLFPQSTATTTSSGK